MSEMVVTQPVDIERVRGRLAGLAALLSVAAWILALQFANAKSVRGGTAISSPAGNLPPLDRARELSSFHAGQTDQAIATSFRCLGLLLTAFVGAYLYSQVRARKPGLGRQMLWSALIGVALIGASTVFGYFALKDVADTFVASGVQTTARAQHLIDASSALSAAAVLDLLSRIVFASWVAVASLQMMRVVLLDRFLGYWGLGAAIALVLLPIGDAMFIGWLGSIGILALGYWPGGRPAGWTNLAAAPN
jgi:hypothetical protein